MVLESKYKKLKNNDNKKTYGVYHLCTPISILVFLKM